MSEWREAVRSELRRYQAETGDVEVSLDRLWDFSREALQSQFSTNAHPEAALRRTLQELRDRGEIEFLGDGRYRITSINPDQPRIWIEKTEIEGRQYKKEGELELGNAVYSPSINKAGHRQWETMREADVGDIVFHLLQDRQLIVGVSTVESELDEDFEGLPAFGWTEEQREAGGYRRWLTEYVAFDEPVHIYDDVLDNDRYYEALHEIRDSYRKLLYDKNLALNQGAYFTQCPPEFAAVIVREGGDEVATELERRGYDVDSVTGSIGFDSAGVYDSIAAATDDITARIESIPGEKNCLAETLTAMIIEDWTEVLADFGSNGPVSPRTEARLEQLRILFERSYSRLESQVRRIESGELPSTTPEQTLFTVLLHDLQDEGGTKRSVRPADIEQILAETYDVSTPTADSVSPSESSLAHPLLAHIDSRSPTVYKFTAPPEYWLTSVAYGSISFEDRHRDRWEEIDEGDVALLHSRAEPSIDVLEDQRAGLVGVAILGERFEKDDPWWLDEHEAGREFSMLVSFERLFLTGNVDEIDTGRTIVDKDSSEIGGELDALTGNCLPIERANEICTNVAGAAFPAQGMFARFRTDDGIDFDRPRALIEAMADDLVEVATVNPHKPFEGILTEHEDHILGGLHFPDEQGYEILQGIETALNAGKHVLLTGPPGTGKTEIAERVCAHLASEHPYLFSGYEMTTATADWSTFDTVGGYMPSESTGDGEHLSFNPGIVLNRLKDAETGVQSNELTIIDELNRADIDKAFGQLFTLLSGQSVQLPYTVDGNEVELTTSEDVDGFAEPHQYVVPNSWRIFATMNAYDKTSLYEMSYAFMRRFAFVRVPAPELEEPAVEGEDPAADLVHAYADAWGIDIGPRVAGPVGRVWRQANSAVDERAIGPAIVEDVVRYVSQHPDEDIEWHLTQAIISYVFPQLEGVPKRKTIVRNLIAVADTDSDLLEGAAREMLQVTLAEHE